MSDGNITIGKPEGGIEKGACWLTSPINPVFGSHGSSGWSCYRCGLVTEYPSLAPAEIVTRAYQIHINECWSEP